MAHIRATEAQKQAVRENNANFSKPKFHDVVIDQDEIRFFITNPKPKNAWQQNSVWWNLFSVYMFADGIFCLFASDVRFFVRLCGLVMIIGLPYVNFIADASFWKAGKEDKWVIIACNLIFFAISAGYILSMFGIIH